MRGVPIVRWREQGVIREERTAEPATLVARLVAAHDGEPDAVEIVRPSLEDVYLQLVSAAGVSSGDGDAVGVSTILTSQKH